MHSKNNEFVNKVFDSIYAMTEDERIREQCFLRNERIAEEKYIKRQLVEFANKLAKKVITLLIILIPYCKNHPSRYNKSREILLSYFMEVFAMAKSILVNDARVMSKGQVTIPKNIRAALGVQTGDRVTFIVEKDGIRVINSAIYAMQKFQEQMKGQAEAAGFMSDEDVANWITESRRKENAK